MKDKSLYLTVTQVLEPFSGIKDINADVIKNAADRGTTIHSICDSIAYNFRFDEESIDEMIKSYCRNQEHFEKEKVLVRSMVDSFEKWILGKKMFNKVPRFFNDEFMLTGECDFIYKNETGQLTLVDLKTPIKESKTWLLQGSAYSYLAKKEGYDIECIEFVKLDRAGKKPKVFYYEENFSLFKANMDAYRYWYEDRTLESPLDYI
jgi:hypothetical protein